MILKLFKQIARRKLTRVETIKTFSESSNPGSNSQNIENNTNIIRELKKREVKAAKNLTLIVVFFAICWMVSVLFHC